MNKLIQQIQQSFYQDYRVSTLKVLIIAWALFVIFLALVVDNAWFLAGMLAYEILP